MGSIKSCPTYANIILKPIENNEELVYCGNSYVTPKEEVTYTEVEIAVCKTKKKELPVPSKTEISEYTVIDFERTRRFNNRSLYFPSSGGRTYRTRHDVGAITPP